MRDLEPNDRNAQRVLVSACLLGKECTYRGDSNRDDALARALDHEGVEIVPFCPEEAGGLTTPRPPADLTTSAEAVLDGAGRVITHCGTDVTEQFVAGAQAALEHCQATGIRRAVLKERSPSCGCAATHVSGAVVDGPGVTAALLRRHGIDCSGA